MFEADEVADLVEEAFRAGWLWHRGSLGALEYQWRFFARRQINNGFYEFNGLRFAKMYSLQSRCCVRFIFAVYWRAYLRDGVLYIQRARTALILPTGGQIRRAKTDSDGTHSLIRFVEQSVGS